MATRVRAPLCLWRGRQRCLYWMSAALPTPHLENAPVTPGLRVLVVDGNSVNQRLWAHMLRRLGLKSLSVGDGWEALDALTVFPSEIILMDLDLPSGAGFEAALYIREQARHPVRPWIIGTTINPQPQDYDRAMSVGMNDFLVKSGQPEPLLRAIHYAQKSLGLPESAPSLSA
jgi:CheY-like chemotaxis protein